MTLKEQHELEEKLKTLTSLQEDQIQSIIQAMAAMKDFTLTVEDLDKLLSNLNNSAKGFNEQFDNIFANEQKKNKKNPDDFDLDLRKVVKRFKQEADELAKQEQENSQKRQQIISELDRLSDYNALKNLAPERRQYAEEQIKLLKSELNLQTTKEELEKKRIVHLSKYNELENELLQQKSEFYKKQFAIDETQKRARAKRERWEMKGFTDDGRRRSFAEITDKIGKFTETWASNSKARNVGNILASGTKIASGALGVIDSGKLDVSATAGKVSGALSQMGPYGAAAGAAVDIFAKLFEIFSKVDTAASKYARTVGGSRFTMMKMRNEAANLAASFSKLGGRTYDAAELLDTMAEYSLTLGRNLEYVSDSSIKAMKDLKDFGIGMDVLNQFDTFGLSVTTVSEKMGKLYAESGKKGLNAKAVSDAMTKNLKLAQTYTFQRGIKALETMAQKSASLKYNMEMASRFADKVSTLEGAVSAGARLSVLGGEFAKFGNPLQMLYGGLQDVEKLNDMLTGMTANLAYYDEKKKQFDISAGDRMRLREVASATGTDYGELVTMAMQSGKRRKIDEQLMSSAGAGVKDEETREFIRNIAEFSGDTAYVKVHGETKKLSELTDRDKATLKREAEARANTNEQNIGDIMQNTRSIQERLDDIVKTLKAQIVKALFRLVGFGDKEYAASMGLSSKSAETYNRLSDDYYHGGMSVSGTRELSSLGFSQTEFTQIQKGEMSQTQFDNLLLNKLKEKEQNAASGSFSSGSAGNFATGGVVRGKGGPTSDAIRANVSNGEYIVNAKDAKENMQLLEGINQGKFSNGANPYKITKVERGGGTETYSQTPKSQTMSFEPLNINIGGRIEVATEKGSKYLTVEDILTPQVLNRLIKEIEVQTNYAFNRTKVNWKYGVG
jgi:hypothetical protein